MKETGKESATVTLKESGNDEVGPLERRMREKLVNILKPQSIELVNESFMHNVPKGSETHFRLLLVSEDFVGLSRVARSRRVHEILADEMGSALNSVGGGTENVGRSPGLHALSLKTLTPEEWQASGGAAIAMRSPPCRSGGKGV